MTQKNLSSSTTDKVSSFFTRYNSQRFDKKQTIIQAESIPDGVYYLIRGKVAQTDIDDNGNELIINIFQKHSFFPLSWVLNDAVSCYYYQALTDAVIVRAPKQDVLKFLEENSDVALNILRRVFSGAEGLLRKNREMMSGSAKSRVLLELIINFERFGAKTDNGQLHLALGETDLAKHTGLSRETVSRQISTIKKDYGIEVNRQGITIEDLDQLRADTIFSEI